MIEVEFSKSGHVANLRPSGELSVDDFGRVTEEIDNFINEHDIVPNLVIDIASFPHWDGFRAARKHFNFVRDHQKVIKKVAIVSDNFAMTTIPFLVDHFVSAKVRHFSKKDRKDAVKWAEQKEDHPGAFEILDEFSGDIIGIRANGIITSQDYSETLQPLVKAKLSQYNQLKLLMIFDKEFASFSRTAVWDDLRFGYTHIADFSMIAIVSDIGWIRRGFKIFGPLMHADINVFHTAEMEQAYSWIKS
jgi:SpoIIAA-like